jgi:pilus assembly protein CpaB
VSNVQVLTAGTNRDQDKARDGEPIDATVVTLMVTPLEAEKITLAQNQGNIMLALRNPLDTETIETSGVRTAALLGTSAPPPVERAAARPTSGVRRAVARPVEPPPPAAAPAKPYVVEGIRGGKRTEDKVIGGKEGKEGKEAEEKGGSGGEVIR